MPVLEELPSYSRLSEAVVAAEGCELHLADGRRLLDLYGGHCVNTLGAGECFGEIAVVGETTRTASASAVDPVRTLALDARRFRRIVRDSGEIGLAVIQALNDRLRVATRREAALRTLASTILRQSEPEF